MTKEEMLNMLTNEDLAFLVNLANELKTQDTACTAKPVFYQIREEKKQVGIDPDYADGMVLSIGEDATAFYSEDDDAIANAKQYLYEQLEDISEEDHIKIEDAEDLETLYEFCEDNDITAYYVGYNNSYNYHNAFLTKKALKRHVELNHYHYNKPVSYADHASRNPEFERLLTIVEKFATVGELLNE